MANIQWANPTNGTFDVGGNWVGGVAPGAADLAQILAAGNYEVTSDSAQTVNDLQMASGVTLDVTNASDFAAAAQLAADTLAGLISVEDGSTLSVGGTVDNTGTVSLLGAAANTELLFTGIPTVLQGGGSIVLSNNSNNIVTGEVISSQTTTVENVNNTISGAGQFGNGVMVFSNDQAGVIDANQATALVLNTAGNEITNTGTFEATAGGNLTIDSEVNNVGGTILANGGTIELNAPVIGGTVKAINGGEIIAALGDGAYFDGLGTHPYQIAAGTNDQVADGNRLYISGVINNKGTITLGSTGDTTRLMLNSGFVTLTGAGIVQMSNSDSNVVYSNNSYFSLTNLNNTIEGAGQIGSGSMEFTNAGLVEANQSLPLYINPNNGLSNSGTLEATSGAELVINTGWVSNAGGLIVAKGAGSAVDLRGSDIGGGTLKTTTGGIIIADNGLLDGASFDQTSPLTIVAGSQIIIGDGDQLRTVGTILNSGTITLDQTSSSGDTWLKTQGPTTLTGGGKVIMVDNTGTSGTGGSDGSNVIVGLNWNRSYALENVNNTISGVGEIGDASMTFQNDAAGIVNANQIGGLDLNTQYETLINAGLLEATNTNLLNGGLSITNTTVYNAGGKLWARGQNTQIALNSSTVEGGTLETSGTVTSGNYPAEINTRGNGGLDGSTSAGAVNNTGLFHVLDSTTLFLNGTLNNTGTVWLDTETNGSSQIQVSAGSAATLTGGGQLIMSDNNNNTIRGQNWNASSQLINVNNTISGTGQLGDGSMMLTNDVAGTIDANSAPVLIGAVPSSGQLVINTQNGGNVINAGLLEATNTGGLAFVDSYVNNSIVTTVGTSTTTGTILADGSKVANAHVDLDNSTIGGGVIDTIGAAVIRTGVGNAGGLDGASYGAITNEGTFQISDQSVLYLSGSIINEGIINLAGVSSGNTDIRISGAATLSGGGQLTLNANAATSNRIIGNNYNAGQQLTNVDNTISGSGQLGAGYLTFINEAAGVVDANINTRPGIGGTLILNTQEGDTTNLGLLEDTGTGGLSIENSWINNQGGTIEAVGAGSHVDLAGSEIGGGTITTATGGIVQVVGGNGNLDGLDVGTIVNDGRILVNDQTALYLEGTIDNAGTISLNQFSASGNTDLRINSGEVLLTGGGTIKLSNNGANRIYSPNSQALVNVDNTIQGAGNIGAGQLQLINSGTILANQTAGLTIDTGPRPTVNQAGGVMKATGVGGLYFNNGMLENFGTLDAENGSSVSMNPQVYDTNNADNELYQGTWIVHATGSGASMYLSGGPIYTDSANITLNGVGTVFDAWQGNGSYWMPLENSLTTITSVGALNVLGLRNYLTTNSLSDAGVFHLGGGTLQAGALAVTSSGYLGGYGTVQDAPSNAGSIKATGGLLDVTGTITGNGALQIAAAATLELGTGTGETVTYLGVADLKLDTPAGFTGTLAGLGLGDQITFTGRTVSAVSIVNNTTIDVTLNGSTNLSYTSATNISADHFSGVGTNTITLASGTSGSVVALAANLGLTQSELLASATNGLAGGDGTGLTGTAGSTTDPIGGGSTADFTSAQAQTLGLGVIATHSTV